jgi:hypothetical protein
MAAAAKPPTPETPTASAPRVAKVPRVARVVSETNGRDILSIRLAPLAKQMKFEGLHNFIQHVTARPDEVASIVEYFCQCNIQPVWMAALVAGPKKINPCLKYNHWKGLGCGANHKTDDHVCLLCSSDKHGLFWKDAVGGFLCKHLRTLLLECRELNQDLNGIVALACNKQSPFWSTV